MYRHISTRASKFYAEEYVPTALLDTRAVVYAELIGSLLANKGRTPLCRKQVPRLYLRQKRVRKLFQSEGRSSASKCPGYLVRLKGGRPHPYGAIYYYTSTTDGGSDTGTEIPSNRVALETTHRLSDHGCRFNIQADLECRTDVSKAEMHSGGCASRDREGQRAS